MSVVFFTGSNFTFRLLKPGTWIPAANGWWRNLKGYVFRPVELSPADYGTQQDGARFLAHCGFVEANAYVWRGSGPELD
jgi:hypothetical protein